jgi:hypothetical protein
MYKTAIVSFLAIVAILAVSVGEAQARADRSVSSKGEFSFQIESNGRVLSTYNHKGHAYIEGQWGDTYAIRVFNHTARRIEAVVTVDGRNVISGKVGDFRKQRGYVIQAYGSVVIDGFRRSMEQVAAFRFTDVGDSYAARMGDATDVGVVGVAVFKEKYRKPVPRPGPPIAYDHRERRLGSGYGASESKKSAPSARSAPPSSYEAEDVAGSGLSPRRQNIGTEYGHHTYSPATNTRFTRQHKRRPTALLTVRYDDYNGLIARGVFPRPRPRCPHSRVTPNPFPDANRFAPPPPSHY